MKMALHATTTHHKLDVSNICYSVDQTFRVVSWQFESTKKSVVQTAKVGSSMATFSNFQIWQFYPSHSQTDIYPGNICNVDQRVQLPKVGPFSKPRCQYWLDSAGGWVFQAVRRCRYLGK